MEFFDFILAGKPLWRWMSFLVLIISLLAIDLGVFNRKEHEIGIKESLWLSLFYIVIAFLFGGWIWYSIGKQSAGEYITGFLVEKSLAIDNLFVISLIFAYFKIPSIYQHRVLVWGVLGVIILRAIMIGFGTALIAEISWILYIFAAFLIITGIKMLYVGGKDPDIASNPLLKFLYKIFRVTPELSGRKFFIRKTDENGIVRIWCTPLFIALLMIEFTDLVFAVDSIPAIFAITLDPYIVYTSNIFAVLGLRALYFAIESVIHRFQYLKQALSVLLIFIGGKVFIADILGIEKFPSSISLSVTIIIIGSGVLYSLYRTRRHKD